ncbi:hypothetical protein WKG88_01720 [Pantoea agglomerans]|uniref:hypothetical protein n=1 Tax=Enterobacter agglomerans TaxID=549 RepID=UPI002790E67A|nr:hypothetical protein [Pantoea agglomerans]MDQ0550668.1 hypothetical protein [Pantoea agglomerans]
MISKDPFGVFRESSDFRNVIAPVLGVESEINISVSIFRSVSLCSLVIELTPNLNHSKYINGFIYDVLNSLVSIMNMRERYLQLNLRSMVEHIARMSLNKSYAGNAFDETVRRKDFIHLKENVKDENWKYLHNVYINACHFVHSSPIAKLKTSSKFLSLLENDSNQSQRKMLKNLHNAVNELMKVFLKHYKTDIENIFYRNVRDLEKILGKSLHDYYITLK